MQFMVCVYYWLWFFKNDNLKYTAISQGKSFNSFSLFYIFFLFYLFLLSLWKISGTEKHHVYNLYFILYALSFINLIYYIVPHIGECFLEDCFHCYCQQIISALPYLKNLWFFITFRITLYHWIPPQTKSNKCKMRLNFIPHRYRQYV